MGRGNEALEFCSLFEFKAIPAFPVTETSPGSCLAEHRKVPQTIMEVTQLHKQNWVVGR